MQQTPAHDRPNPDLLAVMPTAERVVEVGCSRGALARAYKQRHPDSHYLGIEIDAAYAAEARAHCDEVLVANIETLISSGAFNDLRPAQCWVFGDTLEHLQDPWLVLRSLRARLEPQGCVCACIPNMQHWSIQLRLNGGRIEYADSGLLDRTHLRWFSRLTMLQLFESSGFEIVAMQARIFQHPQLQRACELIGQMASQIGHDPDQAIRDAQPVQYVIKAQPSPASPAAAGQR